MSKIRLLSNKLLLITSGMVILFAILLLANIVIIATRLFVVYGEKPKEKLIESLDVKTVNQAIEAITPK